MIRLVSLLVSGSALGAGLLGCEGHSHGGSHGSSFPTEAAGLVALVAAAEVVNAVTQPDPPDPDPVADPLLLGPPDPALPGAVDPHHAFDPIPVLQAIDALDLSRCTHDGAWIGWGHARLTFESSGVASNVVVESPAGLPDAAVTCIRSYLATVSASRFEGDPVTIGASYFVR